MIRFFTMLGVRCMLALGLLAATPANTSPAPYRDVFDAAWNAVNERFYDPDFNGVDWAGLRQRYEPRLAGIATDAQFATLMGQMLGELHVSHLWIGAPEGSRSVGLAIHSRTLSGRRVVLDTAPMSSASQTLRPGDAILSASGDLYGPLGSTASLDVEGCNGTTRRVVVAHEEVGYRQHPSLRWLTLQTGIGQIGYIKALRFDDDTAPLADRAMAELRDAKAIVIDLRRDGGGNISYVRLASYFIGAPRLLGVLAGRTYLERNHVAVRSLDPQRVPVIPHVYTSQAVYDALASNGAMAIVSDDLQAQRFRGPVVLLVDQGTGSASEGFVLTMKYASSTPVTTIGSPTAGYLLGGEVFDLPRGWRISIPTHASWTPQGVLFKDTALMPDIRTTWTREDVCDAHDPDTAAALQLLSPNRPVGRNRDPSERRPGRRREII